MGAQQEKHADGTYGDRADRPGQGELGGVRFCCFCGSADVVIDVRDSCVRCRRCHKTLYFNSKPAVAAVILRDLEVLLVTDSGRSAREQQWDFPGGFLLYGESPEDGLRRELREELKVDIMVGDLLTAALDRYGGGSLFSLNLFYRARLLSDGIEHGAEIEEHGWFPVGMPPPIKYKSTASVLSGLTASLRGSADHARGS